MSGLTGQESYELGEGPPAPRAWQMELCSLSPRRAPVCAWPRMSREQKQEVGREPGLRSTSCGHW